MDSDPETDRDPDAGLGLDATRTIDPLAGVQFELDRPRLPGEDGGVRVL